VHNIINVPLTPLWAADDFLRAGKPAITVSSVGYACLCRFFSVLSPALHVVLQHPHGQFMGREGYRQAIALRLIPSLRAFNPTLILLSIGFDAAAGDVGNCRQFPGEATSRMGIDLQPEDFAWATTEVMKIADICCGGRLVSVLEGGYGEYAPVPKATAVPHVPTTRGASRHQGANHSNGKDANGAGSADKHAAPSAPASQPDTPKVHTV
jgi:acetoin utilization deacetylase AcuC-like enzyme